MAPVSAEPATAVVEIPISAVESTRMKTVTPMSLMMLRPRMLLFTTQPLTFRSFACHGMRGIAGQHVWVLRVMARLCNSCLP